MAEAFFTLNINGEKIRADRENTALFTFIGEQAVYNHIFIVTDEEAEEVCFLFNTHPKFDELEEFIWKHRFPKHTDLPDASELDVEAFELTHYSELRENPSFPESWNKEKESGT